MIPRDTNHLVVGVLAATVCMLAIAVCRTPTATPPSCPECDSCCVPVFATCQRAENCEASLNACVLQRERMQGWIDSLPSWAQLPDGGMRLSCVRP